jgi:hypothetical protein
MCITAIVENDTIKLPAGVHLPDGTPVEIRPQTASAVDPRHAWMLEFVGIANDLPRDMAAEHDHYLYGTPKRDEAR